jgi:hypothetical protein
MDVSMHFAYTQGCGTAIIHFYKINVFYNCTGKSQTENNLVYCIIRLVGIGIRSSFSKKEEEENFPKTNQPLLNL